MNRIYPCSTALYLKINTISSRNWTPIDKGTQIGKWNSD